MTEEYRVQLDVFTGPLDLLLYLIRRDELDIQDISLTHLTEQYLEYVRLLEQIDPNTAGDFLVMASTLVELKSRALLPTPPLESDDESDPRTMLVKQLLEYKRFKDAAEALGTSADDRAKKYIRMPADLPKDLQSVELEEAQVWDLLAAFGRVMSSIGQGPGFHQVTYEDTPIEEYKMYLLDKLEQRGTMNFRTLFDSFTTKAEIVGMFLAILELMRGRRVRAEQDTLHGEIYLFRLEEAPFDENEEEEDAGVLENEATDAIESAEHQPPVENEHNAIPKLVREVEDAEELPHNGDFENEAQTADEPDDIADLTPQDLDNDTKAGEEDVFAEEVTEARDANSADVLPAGDTTPAEPTDDELTRNALQDDREISNEQT